MCHHYSNQKWNGPTWIKALQSRLSWKETLQPSVTCNTFRNICWGQLLEQFVFEAQSIPVAKSQRIEGGGAVVDELIPQNTKPRPSHESFTLWALVKHCKRHNRPRGCVLLKKKLPKQAIYLYLFSLVLLHQDKALENSWTWQSRPCRACKVIRCKLGIYDIIQLIIYHIYEKNVFLHMSYKISMNQHFQIW